MEVLLLIGLGGIVLAANAFATGRRNRTSRQAPTRPISRPSSSSPRPVPPRRPNPSTSPRVTTHPRKLQGRVWVIDGDTIIVAKQKVRLAGIDAPELDQPYGQKAKWAMHAMCKGQTITADCNGEVSHDRLVATCYLPDGRDLAAELVKQGLALDWALFSGGKYKRFEPEGARRRLSAVRHLNPSKNYRHKPASQATRRSH